ncbi:Endonuclease/exonuclease/phosphatase [Protomyces lactucae-debilis]|uniref:Endonuclease/exonuclease/phosphatase n=1 Tax=Protomyces lactucae-debilis TaxID=2754530 RepID=A0A1Y2FPZ6_PROLT|nr:Endonuclease/exonuclease/phosphatase [Protomyces lactucae-debilis]ORY84785.1 Endonuclease/exonuclease/phosphatase [Protomyces lactucae-debilis]
MEQMGVHVHMWMSSTFEFASCQVHGHLGNRPRDLAAIYVLNARDDLEVEHRLDLMDDQDAVCIDIKLKEASKAITLVNVYNQVPMGQAEDASQAMEASEYTLKRIWSALRDLPRDAIITGDMNAHHPHWNEFTQRPRLHQELMRLVSEREFVLQNDGSFTRRGNAGQVDTIIDLTFARGWALSGMAGWRTRQDLTTGSDHEVIHLMVDLPKPISRHRLATQQNGDHPLRYNLKTLSPRSRRNLSKAYEKRWYMTVGAGTWRQQVQRT